MVSLQLAVMHKLLDISDVLFGKFNSSLKSVYTSPRQVSSQLIKVQVKSLVLKGKYVQMQKWEYF